MNGWQQEIFYSYLAIGRIAVRKDEPSVERIVNDFLKAFEIDPRRVEPLYE